MTVRSRLPAVVGTAPPVSVEGELLPPISDDEALRQGWVNLLSAWTDNAFQIPGTRWRMGLDPIIGLVPVVGDLASAAVSLYILSLAAHLQVPRSTLARMMLNVGIDYAVGAIPLVGNLFDFAWKANHRNAQLLERTLAMPDRERRRQSAWDWLLIGVMSLVLIGVFVGSMVAAVLIAGWVARLVFGGS